LPNLQQNFGSGGSATVNITSGFTSTNLTTSWARYTFTVSVPSISGKTVGTSSFLQLFFGFAANTVQTIDIWGVQLEAGSTATAFQTATGTIQGELAACQRYYYRSLGTAASSNYGYLTPLGTATSTSNVLVRLGTPVPLRAIPTSVDFSAVGVSPDDNAITAVTNITLQVGANANNVTLNLASSGLTQFRPYYAAQNNNSAGYIGVSAEL